MFSWFSAIQPLKTFHFGGDEVAATAWLQSPLCDGTNKTDLKLNFTQRVTQDIASMGLAVGAWEDGVMDEHNNAYDINTLTDDVTVYAWSNIWEWGHGDRAYRLANAGYKVDGYTLHDDVIKWNHFPRYWPLVRGIHRSPVNSLHKGLWRGALMFSLIWVWINDCVNKREAGDLRRYRAHYDVNVMNTHMSTERLY